MGPSDASVAVIGVRIITALRTRRLGALERAWHGERFPHRARQHGRAAGARARRCGARRRSARSRTFRSAACRMPRGFIRALGADQGGGRRGQRELGLLDGERRARRSRRRALEVAGGKHDEQFPIDVFQTGSGTSIEHERERGHRARSRRSALGQRGACQRSRQHGPEQQRRRSRRRSTCRAALAVREKLLPALEHLRRDDRAKEARGRPASSRPAARI